LSILPNPKTGAKLTNQFPKLKTTGSFKKKVDTTRRVVLNFKQFIEEGAERLRFSQLFDIRIVRFFCKGSLCEGQPHQGRAKIGLIHKRFTNGSQGLPMEQEGLSKFSRTFLFLKALVSLFLFSE
jgi:hypothetical protein